MYLQSGSQEVSFEGPFILWGFEWIGPFYVVAKGKKMYLLLGPFYVIVAYTSGQGKIGSDSDSKFSDME